MKPFVIKILILGVIILNLSCGGVRDPLPDVYVDITLDLNQPEYFDLNTLGNYIYITGGLAGIIVYHDLSGEFKAYERACPYDFVSNGTKVWVTDISLGIAADTAGCGSKFSITNEGIVISGPAQYPLRQYKVYYNPNSNILRITSY